MERAPTARPAATARTTGRRRVVPLASSVHSSLVSAAVRPGSRRPPPTTPITTRSSARPPQNRAFSFFISSSSCRTSVRARVDEHWWACWGSTTHAWDCGTGAASLCRKRGCYDTCCHPSQNCSMSIVCPSLMLCLRFRILSATPLSISDAVASHTRIHAYPYEGGQKPL